MIAILAYEDKTTHNAAEAVVFDCITLSTLSTFVALVVFKSGNNNDPFPSKNSLNLTVVGAALSIAVGVPVFVGDVLCVGSAVGLIVGIADGDCVGASVSFFEGAIVGGRVHSSVRKKNNQSDLNFYDISVQKTREGEVTA